MKKKLLYLFIVNVCFQGLFAQNFEPEGKVESSKLEVLDKKWLPEYLNTIYLNNGEELRVLHSINDVENSWNTWTSNTDEPAVYVDKTNGFHLYSLSAIKTGKLCPQGFRVPVESDVNSFSKAISKNAIKEKKTSEISFDTKNWTECAEAPIFELKNHSDTVITLTNRIILKKEQGVGVYGTYIGFDLKNKKIIYGTTNNDDDRSAYTVLCIENDSTRYNFDRTYSYANLLNSVSVNFIKKYVIENNVNWLKSSNVKPEMIKIFFDENGINLGEAQTFSLPSTHYNFNRFIKSKESIYFTNDFSNLFDKSGKFYSLNKYSNFKEIPELKNFDISYKENQFITNVILTNGDKYSNVLNYTNNIEIRPFGGSSKALLSFSPFHSGINDVGKHCGSYNLETYNNYKKRYKVLKSSFLFSTLIAGATSFGFYNYGYKRNPYSQFSKTYYSISNMSNKVWPICLSGLFLSTCIDVLHTYLIGKKNEMNYRKYKREIESMELYSNNFLHSGKSSDFDLDGVPDVFDECPKLIGPFENNGCPLDNDLDDDGVLNNLDICPEDFGPASNNGCPEQEELVEFPDVEASFPGGEKELQKFLGENVKFPEICMDMDAQGRVFMKFTVEKDGSITNIAVETNRTGCDEFVREATRVLNIMPNWLPGEVGGEVTRVTCRLPFNFKIN